MTQNLGQFVARAQKRGSNVATGVNYGLQLCLFLYAILQQALKLEGPWRLLPNFKHKHLEHTHTLRLGPIFLKGKPLGSHMGGWKYMVHPNIPIMIEWTRGSRVHWMSSVRKVAQSSTILALDGLPLEFPRHPGYGLGFKPHPQNKYTISSLVFNNWWCTLTCSWSEVDQGTYRTVLPASFCVFLMYYYLAAQLSMQFRSINSKTLK